jgi:hypothetical protein
MTKTIKAWHFVGKILRDGSPIPKDGVTLKYDGEIKLCKSGYHASVDPFDALQYALGETLCLVECGGKIIDGGDQIVCSERTIIARMDATEMLRYYARMQAISVIEFYPNDTDAVVFDYLMTGDELIRDAAWAAGGAGAACAAWAAWAAAGAARDAAWAARDAARAAGAAGAAWAAGDAARAAGAAARAAGAAAWSARDAAWAAGAAARAAARNEFNALVRECFSDFL